MKTNWKVKLIVYLTPILGLYSEIIILSEWASVNLNGLIVRSIKVVSPRANLNYLNLDLLPQYHSYSGFMVNPLDLALYVALLIGLILYEVSKGREMRLVRFSFSILMLSKCLGVLGTLVSCILKYRYISEQNLWLYSGLTLANHMIWGCLAYYVLKSLSVNRMLDSVNDGMDQEKAGGYVTASKLQRLTHYILDPGLFVVTCAGFWWAVGGYDVGWSITTPAGRLFALTISMLISAIIYYLFFEVLFGATPGKFFTETRVLSRNGRKPGLGTGLLRTAARCVPFEPFSFFGRGGGWHDKWSGTMVVQEKRTGVLAGWYLLLIPLLALIWAVGYGGNEILKERKKYEIQKARYESKVQSIKHVLSRLDKDYIIELTEINNTEPDQWQYLKVEDISDDKVSLSAMVALAYDRDELISFEIDKAFLNPENAFPVLEIDRKVLLECITPEFKNYKRNMRNGFAFYQQAFNDNREFEITGIHRIFESDMYSQGSAGCDENTIYFELINQGWPAELIAIDTIEGNLNWTVDLPLRFGNAKESNRFVRIGADHDKPGKRYKFRLTVRDDEGRIQKYAMEGDCTDRYFRRIYEGDPDW
jgi:uncharacterized RDD family membrane protein YckC